MCVRPKIECANVHACEAKNRRNSQLDDSLEMSRNIDDIKNSEYCEDLIII